jgi:ankyrin repeat protein
MASELLLAIYRRDQGAAEQVLATDPELDVFKVMPLHSACATRDPDARYEIAKLLLEHGADPNARQQDDATPLLAADQNKDSRLRDLLVRHGATA